MAITETPQSLHRVQLPSQLITWNFSDSSPTRSWWTVGQINSVTRGFYNGEYEIQIDRSSQTIDAETYLLQHKFRNYSLSVDMKNMLPESQPAFGIVFNHKGGDYLNYYIFIIYPALKYFAIEKPDPYYAGDWVLLRLNYQEDIISNTGSNRLEVRVDSNNNRASFYIYKDGEAQLLCTLDDIKSHEDGDMVGLFVSNYGKAGSLEKENVHFDNFHLVGTEIVQQ